MPDALPIVLQQIDLDIIPGKIPPIVHVSEYDTGRNIVVNLFRDGYPFGSNSIESYTVKVEGSIGKYGFSVNADWADDAEGVVIVHLTEAMTAIHGRVWTKIKLIKSETMQISTCGFWLDCDRAGVEADTVIGAPGFEEQIQNAVNAYMDDSEQLSPIETVHTGSRNLLNPNTLSVGYMNPPTGRISDNADAQGYRTSDYIAVTAGQTLRGCYLDPNDNNVQKNLPIRFITTFDSEKVLLPNDGMTTESQTFVIPSGVGYVRVSYARARTDGSLLYGDNVMIEARSDGWSEYEPYISGESYYLRSEINVRAAQIDGLDAEIEDYLDEHPVSIPVSSVNGKTGAVELGGEDVGVVESEPASKNLLNPNTLSVGYMNPPTGILQPHDAEGYRTSDFIAVTAGQTLRGCYLDPNDNEAQKPLPMRFVTTFDSEKALMPNAGMTTQSQTFVIPNGVGFVRVSYARARTDGSLLYGDNVMLETRADGWSEYEAYSDEKNKTLASDITVRAEQIEGLPDDQDSVFDRGLRYVFDLGSSGFDSGAKVLDIADYSMAFRGTVGSSFGGVTIAHGYQTYMGGWVTVTDTNVSVYTGDTGVVRLNAAHGLTIKDYLFVLIEAGHDDKARVVVGTNGGVFEQDGVTWSVRNGNLTVAPVGNTTMVDCVLSYWCDKWDASTHIYGDSYLSATSPARWSHYLYEDGYTDFLLNGYPGCNAQNAIVAARIVLAHSQPKRIVWAIGMNNNDANSTINAAWQTATEELMALCNERGIDLILATIPNVATVNNAQKNTFVEASGLRYVDFAEAVGAKNDTAWYDGMLSTDGVHPAAPGALALYRQALSDVPELMTNFGEAQSGSAASDPVLEEIVTVTGDGTRPMISADKNGNPFSLKKIVVKMTLGADASAAGNISVQCRPSASVVKNLASLYFPWSASAKAAWTGMGIVEQDAGYWKQHNWGFAAGGYSQIYGSATYCYVDAVSDYPAIGAIYFGSAIPTGMEIKVFGVRE